MNGWIVSLDLLVIGLVLCNAAEEWTAEIYPSPQNDPGKCGRSSASFVCDPDTILTGDEGWCQQISELGHSVFSSKIVLRHFPVALHQHAE